MYTLLKRTFFLVTPFLWKDRTSLIATIATLGLTLIDTLVTNAGPLLLSRLIYYLNNYKVLPPERLWLTVILLVIIWCITIVLKRPREIIF